MAELPCLARSDDPVQANSEIGGACRWACRGLLRGSSDERPELHLASSKSAPARTPASSPDLNAPHLASLTSPQHQQLAQSAAVHPPLHPCPSTAPACFHVPCCPLRPVLSWLSSPLLAALVPPAYPVCQCHALARPISSLPHLLLFSRAACLCTKRHPALPRPQLRDACLLPPLVVLLDQSRWRCNYSFKEALPTTCP
jgi:hypothetical protein